MPLFGSGSLDIVIANGSEELIYCSFAADNKRVTQRTGGAGLNVGMVGAAGNASVQYQHESVNKYGYTPIVPGNTFKFNPSGKPIYLTILSQTNKRICVNLEVNKGSNFIVSKNSHLKQAAKGKTWIEEDGRDHQLVKAESFENGKSKIFRSDMSEQLTGNSEDPDEMFYNLRIGAKRDPTTAPKLQSSIEVIISNGSPTAIVCRVSKEKIKKSYYSIASYLKDGYIQIDSMSSLPFSSSGSQVYITIITILRKEICVNYEIGKSSNVIISWNQRLKAAKTGQLWVDSTGTDHARHDRVDKAKTTRLNRTHEEELIDFNTCIVIANGADDTVHCTFVKKDKSKKSLAGVNGCGFGNSNQSSGYIALISGGYLCFPAKERYIMTITSESSIILCQNIAIDNAGSFIISKGENLHRATFGKLWIDEFGKNHELQSN